MSKLVLLPLLAISFCAIGLAQVDRVCITEMEVPQMQPSLVNSVPGYVHASVKIGPDGLAKAVVIDASDKLLGYEVESLLRDRTRYSVACKGLTVHVDVTYVVEGEATFIRSSRVLFRPQNQYTVITRPIRTMQ